MEAQQNLINNYLSQNGVQFHIPVYQRPYSWKEEQCRQLLKDIREVGSKLLNNNDTSHFIGGIVSIKQSVFDSKFMIIDGQQRLTTILLFLIALREKTKNDGLKSEITDTYLINRFANSETERIKLKPIYEDDVHLKSLLFPDYAAPSQEYSKIKSNFNFFFNEIFEEEIISLYQAFKRLVFVDIRLEVGKDDPQRIFESMNSTGLDLTQSDLIRNYILIDLKYEFQNEIYENYWKKIEANTYNRRFNLSLTSDFFRHFIILKQRIIPNYGKIYDTYKQLYPSNQSISKLKTSLAEICEYSSLFNKLTNTIDVVDKDIKYEFDLLNLYTVEVAKPFLLRVFYDFHNEFISKEILLKVLRLINSYILMRVILDLPTNALNKVFTTLYPNENDINDLKKLQNDYYGYVLGVLSSKTGKHRFPTREEVYTALKIKDIFSWHPKTRMFLFEQLENYGKAFKTNLIDNKNFSIDHICPQNPEENWFEDISLDEQMELKKYVHTISNLTVMPITDNIVQSNSKFSVKRDHSTSGYRVSGLFLNKYLSKLDKWNMETLNSRYEHLMKRFDEVWVFPIEIENKVNQYNVLDIHSKGVTFRKIKSMEWENQIYKNISWKVLLEIVVSELYKREEFKFENTLLGKKLYLTTDPNTLLKPLLVGNNVYIESNLSASDIIERVQNVLEECETDDDLLITLE
ncbi:MAG: DUF262 domain-containing protein [Candidatus Kapabacteria bacterium]|jgi:uncharacterized protein with ParB-like and HNH nuclease domain|nr:DUF262 domain-containing protein [Candidatus Kapabacteria bacterium]